MMLTQAFSLNTKRVSTGVARVRQLLMPSPPRCCEPVAPKVFRAMVTSTAPVLL
jgi:hypothetical protein